MSDVAENFTDTSDGCSLPSDTISRSIRNVHVLLDSRKRLEGQVESWNGSWCLILMKLSQTLMMDVPSHLTPSPDPPGMSKCPCPPRLQLVLGGQVESQHTSWSQILIKLSQMLLMDVPSHLMLSPGHQEFRIYEDIWKTWKVLTWFLMSDLDKTSSQTISLLKPLVLKFSQIVTWLKRAYHNWSQD